VSRDQIGPEVAKGGSQLAQGHSVSHRVELPFELGDLDVPHAELTQLPGKDASPSTEDRRLLPSALQRNGEVSHVDLRPTQVVSTRNHVRHPHLDARASS
jgi:hypothetical protein